MASASRPGGPPPSRTDALIHHRVERLEGQPETGPVATAATARSKGAVYEALAQLQDAGVLIPLSQSPRNQSWEAAGLLELLESLEAGAE